jgi:hypothetical protein
MKCYVQREKVELDHQAYTFELISNTIHQPLHKALPLVLLGLDLAPGDLVFLIHDHVVLASEDSKIDKCTHINNILPDYLCVRNIDPG